MAYLGPPDNPPPTEVGRTPAALLECVDRSIAPALLTEPIAIPGSPAVPTGTTNPALPRPLDPAGGGRCGSSNTDWL